MSRWEAGETELSIDTTKLIAVALEAPIDVLLPAQAVPFPPMPSTPGA